MVDRQIESAESRRELHDRLSQVRENMYAISVGETIPGASALAFPLFGPNKDVRAAVNITGPDHRWTREAMMSHIPRLMEEINYVSEQLGYRQ
jgi:DNA-binding IclR family transcriptional regulator